MASRINPIPDDYRGATPYLTITGADQALEFYKKAFGATEIARYPDPQGKVMHAEFRVGDAIIMVHEENLEWGARSPKSIGDSPASVMLYVEDVDAFVQRAADAGATVTMPVQDQFYGDRSGCLVDPFGHKWIIASRIEELSHEELLKRSEEAFKQPPR